MMILFYQSFNLRTPYSKNPTYLNLNIWSIYIKDEFDTTENMVRYLSIRVLHLY